jgi:hypothetical protein
VPKGQTSENIQMPMLLVKRIIFLWLNIFFCK